MCLWVEQELYVADELWLEPIHPTVAVLRERWWLDKDRLTGPKIDDHRRLGQS